MTTTCAAVASTLPKEISSVSSAESTAFFTNFETTNLYETIERFDQIQNKRETQTVLVVDDSRMQRKRICEFLQQNGYNTEEAADGYDALNICQKISINSFCVDIQMPLMDGYELIGRLRKIDTYKFTNISVISGAHMNKENALARLNELDVYDFYEKPVDLDNLIADLDEKLINEAFDQKEAHRK